MANKMRVISCMIIVCSIFAIGDLCLGQVPQDTETGVYQLMVERQMEERTKDVLIPLLGTDNVAVMVKIHLVTRDLVIRGIKKEVDIRQWDRRKEFVLPGIPAANKMTKKEPFKKDIKQHVVVAIAVSVYVGEELTEEKIDKAKGLVTDILGIDTERGDTLSINSYATDRKEGLIKLLPSVGEIIALAFFIMFIVFLFGPAKGFFLNINQSLQRIAASLMMGSGGGGGEGSKTLEIKGGASNTGDSSKETDEGPLFSFVNENNIEQFGNILLKEQPKKVANILQVLPAGLAARIFDMIPSAKQQDIISNFTKVTYEEPEKMKKTEQEMKDKIKEEYGGALRLSSMLQGMDQAAQESILSNIREKNAEFAEQVEKRLLRFEDILRYDVADLRRIFRAAGLANFARLLKQYPPEILAKFYDKLGPVISEVLDEQVKIIPPVTDATKEQSLLVKIVEKLSSEGIIPLIENIKEQGGSR